MAVCIIHSTFWLSLLSATVHRGISHWEKQIIEQCKYMLVQPDWVAAVVVQVKTQGGTELLTNGTAAEAIEL